MSRRIQKPIKSHGRVPILFNSDDGHPKHGLSRHANFSARHNLSASGISPIGSSWRNCTSDLKQRSKSAQLRRPLPESQRKMK
jgi:hypothetical protein